MVPSIPIQASHLLELLGAALILTAFWMLAARRLNDYLYAYIAQSSAVAAVALVVGIYSGRWDLYVVAGLTILVKPVAIGLILRRVIQRLPPHRAVRQLLSLPMSLLIGVMLVIIAYVTSPTVVAPGTFLNEPPLAVSLALVLFGLFIISIRRHVLAQVIGLLTIENGLFSGAIAIAYGMPLIVEFGILFDVLVAVIVLTLLASLIRQHLLTADTGELTELRG